MESLPSYEEIKARAEQSRLLKDPHVKRLLELSRDRSLFEKSPDYLAKLQHAFLLSHVITPALTPETPEV